MKEYILRADENLCLWMQYQWGEKNCMWHVLLAVSRADGPMIDKLKEELFVELKRRDQRGNVWYQGPAYRKNNTMNNELKI